MLKSGLPFTLGTVKYDLVAPYLSDCWYKHLFKFVSKQPLEIVEDYPEVPTLRDRDSYIMQAFIDAGFRNKDLYLLNIMRMAMKVVTIADIATPDGKKLLQRAFLLQSGNHLRDHYDWPRDPPGEFSPAMLLLWQNALKSLYTGPLRSTKQSRSPVFQAGPRLDRIYYQDQVDSILLPND